MIYQLSTDNFELSESVKEYIDKRAKKLGRYLPGFVEDLPLLRFYLRAHTKRRYFDGSIELFLPKQMLVAHFREKTPELAAKVAFSKIQKELQGFKGRHFETYG